MKLAVPYQWPFSVMYIVHWITVRNYEAGCTLPMTKGRVADLIIVGLWSNGCGEMIQSLWGNDPMVVGWSNHCNCGEISKKSAFSVMITRTDMGDSPQKKKHSGKTRSRWNIIYKVINTYLALLYVCINVRSIHPSIFLL